MWIQLLLCKGLEYRKKYTETHWSDPQENPEIHGNLRTYQNFLYSLCSHYRIHIYIIEPRYLIGLSTNISFLCSFSKPIFKRVKISDVCASCESNKPNVFHTPLFSVPSKEVESTSSLLLSTVFSCILFQIPTIFKVCSQMVLSCQYHHSMSYYNFITQ